MNFISSNEFQSEIPTKNIMYPISNIELPVCRSILEGDPLKLAHMEEWKAIVATLAPITSKASDDFKANDPLFADVVAACKQA